jgi:hypothetical protein
MRASEIFAVALDTGLMLGTWYVAGVKTNTPRILRLCDDTNQLLSLT